MPRTHSSPAPHRVETAAKPAAGVIVLPSLGAAPGDRIPVRFGFFDPAAREVFLVGSFNGWNPRATPLVRDALGDWTTELALPRGEYRYRLVVDGEWRDDPCAAQTAMNPFGGYDAVIVV